jgi:two-component system KDP operon response regulator KdpE
MSEQGPLVLIVEDEAPLRRFLRAALVAQGYRLVEAETASEGLQRATEHNPDIVLLDLGLPDGDGLDVTSRLREWTGVPIIVLSARGQERDKVQALDVGADDYLTKPFGTSELLARIRVALRRVAERTPTQEPVVSLGDVTVDLARRLVTRAGKPVHLTPHEYKLLTTLLKYAGKVVTHKQLLKEVWGPQAVSQTHYLRVYMAPLRFGQANLPDALRRLRAPLAGDREQQARLDALADRYRAWLALLDLGSAAGAAPRDPALVRLLTERKAQMDAMRGLVDALLAAEERRLARAEEKAAWSTRLAAFGGAALLLALGVVTGAALRRWFRRMEGTYAKALVRRRESEGRERSARQAAEALAAEVTAQSRELEARIRAMRRELELARGAPHAG